MAGITDPEIEAYCAAHSPDEGDLLAQLVAETHDTTDLPQMQVGRLEGGFLRLLVGLTGARHILEIGTFTGYSALAMASALPPDGTLVTCDIDEHATAIARRYWARATYGSRIRLVLGDARETVAKIPPGLDLVFIDADKTSYATYWDLVVPKLRPGGLIVVDNTLWSGTVLDPQDDDARAIATFNDKVQADDRVEAVQLPVRDGMTLARVL